MTAQRKLTDTERVSWLQLSRSENIGPVTFQSLLQRFGTASAAIEALPSLVKRGGAKPIRIYSRSLAEEDLGKAAKIKANFVAAGERGYPPYLRHIHAAPPLLCVAGNLDLAQQDAVAIVGARNASASGMKFTRHLADKIAEAGFLIVSGLARGIDTAAHQAALARHTAAVLAGGLDHYYPPENQALQKAIAENGLLISEMPPGTAPKAEHFPRRNRIISGMSRAIVVVEAAMRSGSLITARFAAEQGREVFAVPGSPLDPRCEGTNRLIKDGANILLSAQGIVEALRTTYQPNNLQFLEPEPAPMPQWQETSQSDRDHVISLLSPTAIEIDDLARESGLEIEVILSIMLELELAGRVVRESGHRVALC
jgi:DNA processing protein